MVLAVHQVAQLVEQPGGAMEVVDGDNLQVVRDGVDMVRGLELVDGDNHREALGVTVMGVEEEQEVGARVGVVVGEEEMEDGSKVEVTLVGAGALAGGLVEGEG